MSQQSRHFSLKVLTINIHKGFTAFNRRFILPELRDAVRTVSADIVCLQEVMGAHETANDTQTLTVSGTDPFF
jgi:endonuclease/exonuclease/phosphatase family metal-dependent hydrolase